MTSESWAYAAASPALLNDVWFTLNGADMEDMVRVLMRSRRHYRNLRIVQGNQLEEVTSMTTSDRMPGIPHFDFQPISPTATRLCGAKSVDTFVDWRSSIAHSISMTCTASWHIVHGWKIFESEVRMIIVSCFLSNVLHQLSEKPPPEINLVSSAQISGPRGKYVRRSLNPPEATASTRFVGRCRMSAVCS